MENIKSTIAWIAPPYSILIASIYLFGYWSTFDINPFQYSTVSEILMLAIAPSLFIFVVTIAGIGMTFMDEDESSTAYVRPKLLKPWVKELIILLVILPGCWLVDFYWILLLGVVRPTVYIFSLLPIFEIVKSPRLQTLIILMVTFVPILTCVYAKTGAYGITSGENYWAVEIESNEYRYLGHVGEKTFFTNATNDTILILPDSENSLILTKVKRSTVLDAKRKKIKEFFSADAD